MAAFRFEVNVAGCSAGVDVDAVGVGAAAGVDAEAAGVDPDACDGPGGIALLGLGVPVSGAFCGKAGCKGWLPLVAGDAVYNDDGPAIIPCGISDPSKPVGPPRGPPLPSWFSLRIASANCLRAA